MTAEEPYISFTETNGAMHVRHRPVSVYMRAFYREDLTFIMQMISRIIGCKKTEKAKDIRRMNSRC